MNIQYFINPLIIFIIFAAWLMIGYRISKKSTKKGFIFIGIYALIATHCCIAANEQSESIPIEKEREISSFLKVNEHRSYEFCLVELNEAQYIRVRPISNKFAVDALYLVYRNLLLNSWIPEYVYNINGALIDWTTDNHDDSRYQNKWDHSKEIKELKRNEVLSVIKEPQT